MHWSQKAILYRATCLLLFLPILAGAAAQAGWDHLAVGLSISAIVAGCVAVLAYLNGPGEMQRVDIAARERREAHQNNVARRPCANQTS